MADNLKPVDRQKAMRAVKGKGTTPERRLFAMLAGMRLKGWRKNAADITGKPDVVFSQEHVVIFVDGCFWHGCPHCQRKLKPDSNRQYWERKINRNIELAKSYNQKLLENGWTVIRIWEHELKKPAERLQIRDRIRQAIKVGTDK